MKDNENMVESFRCTSLVNLHWSFLTCRRISITQGGGKSLFDKHTGRNSFRPTVSRELICIFHVISIDDKTTRQKRKRTD